MHSCYKINLDNPITHNLNGQRYDCIQHIMSYYFILVTSSILKQIYIITIHKLFMTYLSVFIASVLYNDSTM